MAFRALFGFLALICALMGFGKDEQAVIRLDDRELKILLDEYAEWRGILSPVVGKGVDQVVEGLFPWISFPMAIFTILQQKVNAIRKLREGGQPEQAAREKQPASSSGTPGNGKRYGAPVIDESLLT